jgi:DNA-directed RNA polymerase subunit RPC12/RpoP
MPVQFACTACRQMLSVAARKAGSKVRCPRCQTEILVPGPAVGPNGSPPVAPPTIQVDAPRIVTALEPPSNAPVVRFDKDLVSVPRYLLYAQGALLAVVVLMAFAMGFLSGRGARVDEPPAERGPVTIQGTVIYQAQGREAADSGAAVVALPAAVQVDKRIFVGGLNPREPIPPPGHEAVAAIDRAAGAYARTDDQGRFELQLRPGKYRVLVVSGRAVRALGTEPRPSDLVWLGKVFEPAADLVGPARYLLQDHTLPDDAPLEFHVGQSGQ